MLLFFCGVNHALHHTQESGCLCWLPLRLLRQRGSHSGPSALSRNRQSTKPNLAPRCFKAVPDFETPCLCGPDAWRRSALETLTGPGLTARPEARLAQWPSDNATTEPADAFLTPTRSRFHLQPHFFLFFEALRWPATASKTALKLMIVCACYAGLGET